MNKAENVKDVNTKRMNKYEKLIQKEMTKNICFNLGSREGKKILKIHNYRLDVL